LILLVFDLPYLGSVLGFNALDYDQPKTLTDRQTDRQTDKQTDRQTDRHYEVNTGDMMIG